MAYTFDRNMKIKIIQYLICIMLLWALLPFNPYGYYMLLRIVVFTYAAFQVVRYFKDSTSQPHGWIALAIALAYNPIHYMHFGRPLWGIINLITVVLILISPPTPNKIKKP